MIFYFVLILQIGTFRVWLRDFLLILIRWGVRRFGHFELVFSMGFGISKCSIILNQSFCKIMYWELRERRMALACDWKFKWGSGAIQNMLFFPLFVFFFFCKFFFIFNKCFCCLFKLYIHTSVHSGFDFEEERERVVRINKKPAVTVYDQK